jgi:glutamyl/glutaminyl-tRNA synthetase
VRSIDLALYADELAARAATLAAQSNAYACPVTPEALERAARRALDEGAVARLEALGLMGRLDSPSLRARSAI